MTTKGGGGGGGWQEGGRPNKGRPKISIPQPQSHDVYSSGVVMRFVNHSTISSWIKGPSSFSKYIFGNFIRDRFLPNYPTFQGGERENQRPIQKPPFKEKPI